MPIDWNEQDLVFLQKQLKQGRVCLFLGAGFSVDSKNGANGSPPLGGKLAELLAQEAALPYGGESLALVYEAVQKQIGKARLWDLLRKLYDIRTFHDWYAIPRSITWYRMYTLNIDNLMQKVYSRPGPQHLRTIINPAPAEARDELYGDLQCVHLHGFVETPDKGLTFSLPDFGSMTAQPHPWYQVFVEDFYYRSFISASGRRAAEPDRRRTPPAARIIVALGSQAPGAAGS